MVPLKPTIALAVLIRAMSDQELALAIVTASRDEEQLRKALLDELFRRNPSPPKDPA